MAFSTVGLLSPLLRNLRASPAGAFSTLTAPPQRPALSRASVPIAAAAKSAAAVSVAVDSARIEGLLYHAATPSLAVSRRFFHGSEKGLDRSGSQLEGRTQVEGNSLLAGVRCVPAGEAMVDDAARLMELFVASEPLLTAGAVSTAAADVRQGLLTWTRSMLRLGLSVVALSDSAEAGGSAVVGVRLCFSLHRDRPLGADMLPSYWLRHPATVAIEGLIDRLETEVDVFERYSTNAVAVGGFNSVSRDCRGRGVAAALVAASDELATRQGFAAIISTATGAYSQALLRAQRYEELASIDYATNLNAQLFNLHKLGPHKRLVLFGKKLR